MKVFALLVLLLPLAVACDDEEVSAADDCASGFKYSGGEDGEEEMYPGEDCIGCHTREDEGPDYTIAGTVYVGLSEPKLCLGLGGTTIEITDANGVVKSMKSNESGNFFHEGSIATPYTAKLIDAAGKEFPMVTPQTNGDCNTCHSPGGSEGAAGRIYVF